MSSNLVANGHINMEKEIKQRVKKKYESDFKSAGFYKKLKIRRKMKYEIAFELLKKRKEISSESLF